jgi:serine protease inhibitor
MNTTPFLSFSLLLLVLLLAACSKSDMTPRTPPTQIHLSARAPAAIYSSNAFGVELFKRVAREEEGNLMLSPLSASIALTMLLNGSHGETYAQIRDLLNYPADMTRAEINEAYQSLISQLLAADPEVTLHLANAVFYRQGYPVKESFLRDMKEAFDALVAEMDFAHPTAVDQINQWASDHTNQRIPKVLDQIPGNVIMYLMNALYFKGDWTHKFDKQHTAMLPFTRGDGSTVEVPTMRGEVEGLTLYNEDFTALELPYGRRNFSMVLLLPTDDLTNFYDRLTPAKWQALTATLTEQTLWQKVQVVLPRFKFDYEKQLNETLQAMGMVDAFDERADLTGIADADLQVSMVKQNAFIAVDEEGSEAAAVTTIEIRESALAEVRIDRPFVFAIRERTTNTLLFIGAVRDPLAE